MNIKNNLSVKFVSTFLENLDNIIVDYVPMQSARTVHTIPLINKGKYSQN